MDTQQRKHLQEENQISLKWSDLEDIASSNETKQEQECLKHIWLVLQNLRFLISEQPESQSTNVSKQLRWFDEVLRDSSELKTASYCRKHARKLDALADAVVKSVGPKRILAAQQLMTSTSRRKLLDRIDGITKSVQGRMKNLHGAFLEPKPPVIYTQASGTRLVWVLGVVSLYPLIFSQLAREFEWIIITPVLAILGASLSFLFFIEITAIIIAKPYWVFDRDAAGRILHDAIKRDLWPILLIVTLILWISQLYWLIVSMWDLASPLGTIAATLMVAIIIGLFSVFLYPWTRWRYNQYLFCPVCGVKMVSYEALDTHCKHKYGFNFEQIVDHSLEIRARQPRKSKKKERRNRSFLIMGAFYLLVEIFFYLEYGDLNAFLMLGTMCVFFLILDILQGDYISYKEMEDILSEGEKEINRKAALVLVTAVALSFMMTFLIGTAVIIAYTVLFEIPSPVTLAFAYNLGLGALVTFPLLSRTRNLFFKELNIEYIPVSAIRLIIYSLVIYLTDLMLSLWAASVVMSQYLGYSYTYGVFAGFVLILLVAREMWYMIIRANFPKGSPNRPTQNHPS